LDFDGVNYALLDRQGTALRILTSVPDGFWSSVGDGRVPRSFAAEFSSETIFRNLNITPMALHGSLESRSGTNLNSISENKDFRLINKMIDLLCNEFEVKRLARCGLRLYCIDT
jgi:hypothetical protein